MSVARDIAPIAPAQRTTPHNLDAEKSVLGAVFIKPAAFDEVAPALQVDDFFFPAHREIFETMLALSARRKPIDPIAVADELKTKGLLPRLDGGESYLLALANAVPTAENVAHYARIVKEKATLRQLIAACAEVQSSAYGDFGELDAFLADAETKVVKVARRARRDLPALVDLVARLAPRGARLASGIRTLDEAHRGGFRPGRLVVVGGAPGAAKTSLVVYLAVRWARAGVPVVVLAADEPMPGLLTRVGQILGLEREALEEGAPDALQELRTKLAEVPQLRIVDADDDGATVEAAAASLGEGAVLVVDSLQTARAAGSVEADGPRARVDAVLAACKLVARRGVTIVATCELARGAYRSRDPLERTEDLAAGKESGGIEYAAATLLVLRSVPDAVGLIDATIAKNRGGQKTPFRLAMNFERASLTETARPDDAASTPADELASDMKRARGLLRGAADKGGVRGTEALIASMNVGKARGRYAVRALEAAGELRIERGPGTARRLFLADPPNSPNPPGGSGDSTRLTRPAPFRGAGHGAGESGGSGRDQARAGDEVLE